MACSEDPTIVYHQEQLTKLDLEIRACIQDIQECPESMEALKNLNRTVAEKFQEIKFKINEMEKLAFEQDKETSKIIVLKSVENFRKRTNNIQGQLRKANLVCQLSKNNAYKESLFKNQETVRKRPTVINRDSPVNNTSNVTQNLMTLTQMMSDQVKQTEQTMGNLLSSSQQIGETHEELKSTSGHISNSRKLLTKYGRRELTDKLLILLALIFFFASVLYVIRKRFIG